MTAVYESYPELTREAIKQGTFISGLRVLSSPMSRKNWQDFTGVKVRSQYNHERDLGVQVDKNFKNFVLVDSFSSHEECRIEFDLCGLEYGPYRVSKKRVFDGGERLFSYVRRIPDILAGQFSVRLR